VGPAGAIEAAAGSTHSFVLLANGDCLSWGSDAGGQLGNAGGGSTPTPGGLQTPAGLVKSVASGAYHSMALLADGTLRLWGTNAFGELGTGGAGGDVHTPGPPVAIPAGRVKQIAAGYGHCVALLDDGTVWTWGLGGMGQLGRSPATSTGTPTPVPGLTRIVQISAGALYTLALRDDGTMFGFGFNVSGELGAVTPNIQETPIATLAGVAAIMAGEAFTLTRR